MTRLLSRSQAFDFVRLEGLQKLTNNTAYDWDFYILKELVDNALDADEVAPGVARPVLRVVMSYAENKTEADGRRDRSLSIEVSNAATFPLDRVADLFDLEHRYSVKDHYHYPTRGAQGNALKTLLGIPYALRYHYFSDYTLDRVPLSITCGGARVEIELRIDELRQTVAVETTQTTSPLVDEDDAEAHTGTTVRVQIARFWQKPPRTPDDLLARARAFAFFNPHADFHFEFIFNRADGSSIYEPFSIAGDPGWQGKYDLAQAAPVHWYRRDAFRGLAYALAAAYADQAFTVADFVREFGLDGVPADSAIDAAMPLLAFIEQGGNLQHLYQRLCDLPATPRDLGGIGATHLQRADDIAVNEDGDSLFFYREQRATSVRLPYTLEVALYPNTGDRRRVIVGINHTPTYSDPFFNKPLLPPGAEDPARSLEKLLDHYTELPQPVTLVLHLIAPNIIYESYGKNAISDEPYRDTVTQLVDAVVKAYIEATRPPEPVNYLTAPATAALPDVIAALAGSRFTEAQLLYALKRHLHALGDADITTDLASSSADSRLRTVIEGYLRENDVPDLYRRQTGRLAVPRHGRDTINIAFARMELPEIAVQFGIRAVVITNSASIEEMLIAAGFAMRYDFAILRADGGLPKAIDLLASKYKNILSNNDPYDDALLPQLWIVRDATPEAIQATRGELHAALARYKITFESIVDLGLHPDDAQRHCWLNAREGSPPEGDTFTGDERRFFAAHTAHLESLSPTDLQTWFEAQLSAHDLPLKTVPPVSVLAGYAVEELSRRIRGLIMDEAFTHHGLDDVQRKLAEQWHSDNPEWDAELHANLVAALRANRDEAWHMRLGDEVSRLLMDYMRDRRDLLRRFLEAD